MILSRSGTSLSVLLIIPAALPCAGHRRKRPKRPSNSYGLTAQRRNLQHFRDRRWGFGVGRAAIEPRSDALDPMKTATDNGTDTVVRSKADSDPAGACPRVAARRGAAQDHPHRPKQGVRLRNGVAADRHRIRAPDRAKPNGCGWRRPATVALDHEG